MYGNTTVHSLPLRVPSRRASFAAAALAAALFSTASPAVAQLFQQGPKLVGTGNVGAQGTSTALSADGNSAIVGGLGAAWIFVRSGGAWTQQAQLIGAGTVGSASQGASVALSADGNTAIVGGPEDNSGIGAAWVFVRSGGTWTQQTKLVGTASVGQSFQGTSVALAADGNTAIIGGFGDNSEVGAAWVFTRSNGIWAVQHGKLTGGGEVGSGNFGVSVALSADGQTALVGGNTDDGVGAAWVFAVSNGIWTQQGAKLTASDEIGTNTGFASSVALAADGKSAILGGPNDGGVAGGYTIGAAWIFAQSNGAWSQQVKLVGSDYPAGNSDQGWSVALSADGMTAMVGGWGDDNGLGAAWMFSRSGDVWRQQAKLVGAGYSGSASPQQGWSIALSANGNTAIVGGVGDNGNVGAAWIFVRPGWASTATHDFNGDGYSDILWRNSSSGQLAAWLMQGGQISSGANIATVPGIWSVAGTRDFDGDGDADVLWLDSVGDVAIWLMKGAAVNSYSSLGNIGTQWNVTGTGDFNGDGVGDILWRNTSTGDIAIWFAMGGQFSASVDLGVVPTTWQVVGAGDFNGDGTTDILWRNTTNGDLTISLMNNGQAVSSIDLGDVPLTWSVVGTGDFNGDGMSDILWRDTSGNLAIWLMNNGQFSSGAAIAQVPTTWSVAETGDFDGDGKSDIVWIDTSGDVAIWQMNGLAVSAYDSLGNVGTSWQVQGQNAD